MYSESEDDFDNTAKISIIYYTDKKIDENDIYNAIKDMKYNYHNKEDFYDRYEDTY